MTDRVDPLTALVLRLADGDRSAFDPLYEAVAPRVDAICGRALGAGPDAEDAAQVALLHEFERVDRYDPARGPALPWILGIAAWEARTVARRRHRRREDAVEVEVEAPTPADDLAPVLAELSPADREVVLAALGVVERPPVPPATFRKRLQRTVARLRAAFAKESP
jgi:RNA polymerase sigma-70 factor (ECF subfamily)